MKGVFADKANQFVFKVALPVLLFEDLSNSDFEGVGYQVCGMFCFASTLEGTCWRFFCPWHKDRGLRGIHTGFLPLLARLLLGIAFY